MDSQYDPVINIIYSVVIRYLRKVYDSDEKYESYYYSYR